MTEPTADDQHGPVTITAADLVDPAEGADPVERADRLARLAFRIAEVHRTAAVKAYAGIFPTTSEPPTTTELAVQWRSLLTDGDGRVFVARMGSVVVGAAALKPDLHVPAGLLLARLYVDPSHQGSGLGSRLHDAAVGEACTMSDSLNLWVLEENRVARTMYERRGWQLVPGKYLPNEPPEVRDVLYQLVFPTP
ncbi:MAG: GNAT family N-acetyltransferase [Acidimicrobiales bacterium]